MWQGGKRLQHDIVEGIGQRVGKLADSLDLVFLAGRCHQLVPGIDKGEQRLQFVIAILAPPADMQREVDLGVGGLGQVQMSGFRHCERSEAIHLLSLQAAATSEDGLPRRLRLLAMTTRETTTYSDSSARRRLRAWSR